MVSKITLPNGFEIVTKTTSAPVVSLQVWVDVGSIDESPTEAGYSHFLEHMLFKGTKKRSTQVIAQTIEGAGGEMNAFTSFEYTVYHITIAAHKAREALEVLADMVLDSQIYPKEFAPEKEVILEEIKRSNDSPDRQLYKHVYSGLYGQSGYGRPVIGFPKTDSAATATELKSFYKRWYHPSLMTLVMSGQLGDASDSANLINLAAKLFNGHQHRKATTKAPRVRRRLLTHFTKQQLIQQKIFTGALAYPIQSVRWNGSLPGLALSHPELLALDMALIILGQGESSRLYQHLIQHNQIATSISAGLYSPIGQGFISFDADIPLENTSKFRNAFVECVEQFLDSGPTEEEIQRVKRSIEGDRVYSLQSVDGLASRIGQLQVTLGNTSFDLEYVAELRELTAEDVLAAAKKYLTIKTLREFSIYPKHLSESPLVKTANKRTETRPATKPSTKPSMTSTQKTQKSFAKSWHSKNDPSIKKLELPNGVQVIMMPRNDLPITSVQAAWLGGTRFENHQNSGIGNLLADTLQKAPEGMSSLELTKELENLSSRIDSFSGRNSFGISSTMLTRNQNRVFDLFFQILDTPALDPNEIKIEQLAILEEIKSIEDEGARLAGKLFNELLFEGHAYSKTIMGTLDSVKNLTAQNLRTHFQHLKNTHPLTLSIVGKFNESLFLKHASKLPTQNRQKIEILKPHNTVPAIKSNRHAEVKKNKEQSHIFLGYLSHPIKSNNRYISKILSTILGGQSGRLFREIRDKQGLCYTIAPTSFEGLDAGYFGIYIGTDPNKRFKAIDSIHIELEKLCRKPVGNNELSRAKQFLLGRHCIDLQQNASITNVIGFNNLFGLDFDEHLKLESNLRNITPKTLQNYCQELFGQHYAEVVVV